MLKPKHLNITQLMYRYDLDRATVRKRLMGIDPVSEKQKEKLYAVTDELDHLLSGASGDPLDAERLRKLSAEADIKQMEAQTKRGEMASVSEFIEITQQIFGAMHKRIAVQMPSKLAAKLVKAKTAADIKKLLGYEINAAFDDLRNDHTKFLSLDGK